jgi:hypothetical protein
MVERTERNFVHSERITAGMSAPDGFGDAVSTVPGSGATGEGSIVVVIAWPPSW